LYSVCSFYDLLSSWMHQAQLCWMRNNEIGSCEILLRLQNGILLLKEYTKLGETSFCLDCTEWVTSQLSDHNEAFKGWVSELEGRYGIVCNGNLSSVSGDFSEAMRERDQLRQRCVAVGHKLSSKQKMSESYDAKFNSYESKVVWILFQ